jgi:hypothetical protein
MNYILASIIEIRYIKSETRVTEVRNGEKRTKPRVTVRRKGFEPSDPCGTRPSTLRLFQARQPPPLHSFSVKYKKLSVSTALEQE